MKNTGQHDEGSEGLKPKVEALPYLLKLFNIHSKERFIVLRKLALFGDTLEAGNRKATQSAELRPA
ncbi:MAG: hypothetical protein QGH77_09115 [Planctomycetota bacterium]|jgi:hypothetical protein|nr:hypothetical protein [Planctomycetota bacterium]